MFGRKRRNNEETGDDFVRNSTHTERTLTNDFEPSKAQVKRATRTRLCWALIASFCLLIAVVFLILVELGDTQVNSTLNQIYFIRLDLTNIIPVTVPDATLINSIAQTLGLHDFYTVGLWGFCEGYNGQGTVECSAPQTLYWFNPVEILQSQLLSGATIALPAEVNDILSLIRTVSNWMFGLFLSGACLSFLMIFLVPISVFSRWATLPIMMFTFLAALLVTVAAVIATVLFTIMQDAITSQTSLNIGASIGREMFVFMWIAAATSILAWLIMLGQCCCCASRRDVKTGRKRGSKKAWRNAETMGVGEKGPEERRGRFGRRKV
ncbi:hypothetical protein BAUCODRAFT_33218 [Baudoinia panamericana UAMH 10762]|uniref:Integral membrane protein n=1 Tax=Baudoinia panamericana (strain UAMH 10762) TaxID=717646 RepID=M2LSQ7_BAUPA|nr:uncharacterized protein BAUCODRAFT_33218 [Baudoinia panamericana UAMH 10762]EMC97502.1 hypothetical protein BAUCODRAFT_33218 [Baudoinia panamericana UAMH 10762]